MNQTPTKLVHDAATGQIKEVELTAVEMDQRQQDQTLSETEERALLARQQADEQAREKALAKRFSDEEVGKSQDWKDLALKLNARIEYLERLFGL